MTQKINIRVLTTFIFIFSSFICAADDDVAIKVKNHKITAREFLNRLNSLPRSAKGSPEEIKENLICTLIAESVLAYEASASKLDTSEQQRLTVGQFKKEALYEHWMTKEIRDKVKYSEKELQDTYAKLREQRTVEFWTFSAESDALKFKQSAIIDSSIMSSPQIKVLECGEALEDVEDAIYALKTGELTPPIQIDNSYYVFRLKSVNPHPDYSTRNFIYWIKDVEDLVRARKEEKELNTALLAIMEGSEFIIDNEAYNYLLSKLYPIIYGTDNQLRYPKAELIQTDLINNEIKNIDIDKRAVVRFKNGKEWTTDELWKKIAVCPYPLNYKNPADLEPGLLDVIRRIIILENIAGDSQEKGYGGSSYVQSETAMWENNSSAYAFIKNYSSSLTIGEEELKSFYDSTKFNYIKPEARKIEYITVNTKEQADEVYRKAISGSDFEDLYRKYVNSSKFTEDEIATYITENMWGDIGKNAFKLKKAGEISRPFLYFDTSYVVVKLLETRFAAPYSFEEMRDKLQMQKRYINVISYLNDYLAGIVKNYDIYINRDVINKTAFLEGDMTVKKTHFPLRNTTPSFIPFSYKADWYKNLLERINHIPNQNN